jgi:hypothetical protein
VGHPDETWVATKTEAAQALAQAGFTRPEARAFVERAAADLPHDTPLERLLRVALKCSTDRTFDRVLSKTRAE